MTTTFITGANKSLGFETARCLVAAGHTVLIGARDPERGRTAAEPLGARFVEIDVTDDASVQATAADVAAHEGEIDVLVDNAGVLGRVGPVEQYTAAGMGAVLDVDDRPGRPDGTVHRPVREPLLVIMLRAHPSVSGGRDWTHLGGLLRIRTGGLNSTRVSL